MTEQPDPEAQPVFPALKVEERDPDPDDPWADDVLDRKEIADRLTSIVRGQEAPFVISIDGRWGTGKTFLLKRWQQDLENDGWQAIYYNAWEDDFAGDPLLAVTGQLSEHFREGTFRAKVLRLGRLVAPFVRSGASTALMATTGIPLPARGDSKPAPTNQLADYLEKRDAKNKLKEFLGELAADVRAATGQPLVFIIDELDRCRPTFAIELLERVKHIFDVRNIVFVFGINRGELTKSLRSIYGEIEAGEYLRRFFDYEFVLRDADPVAFCTHLMQKFGLGAFLRVVDQRRSDSFYREELDAIDRFLPIVLGRMGLGLRDMDYCVRLIALAARESLVNQRLYGPLLVLLAATKLSDPDLYRRFVHGAARGADLINHLRGQQALAAPSTQDDASQTSAINWLEAAAYCADDSARVLRQLRLLESGEALDQPEYVSSELATLDVEDGQSVRRLKDIIQMLDQQSRWLEGFGAARHSLAKKIDIYTDLVRR